MREFKLNTIEEERTEAFHKRCKRKTRGTDVNMTYHFYPTGIGTTVQLKGETLGVDADITEVSNWQP